MSHRTHPRFTLGQLLWAFGGACLGVTFVLKSNLSALPLLYIGVLCALLFMILSGAHRSSRAGRFVTCVLGLVAIASIAVIATALVLMSQDSGPLGKVS